MRKLTKAEIDQISSESVLSSIYYSDIRDEWVDHCATRVEELMDSGNDFNDAFLQARKEIRPSVFQRRLLMASHVGFVKSILSNFLRGSILLKSIMFSAVCLTLVYFFWGFEPMVVEKHIKTLFVSVTVGLALMGLWGGFLKKSKVVAAGNSLWLMICISQLSLSLDLLVWLGVSPVAAIFLITFVLSILFISGLTDVVNQTKRLKKA
ncbi:hypothetical protein [Algoriphagus namhaensis]